jgi:hypothetical protein
MVREGGREYPVESPPIFGDKRIEFGFGRTEGDPTMSHDGYFLSVLYVCNGGRIVTHPFDGIHE